MYQLDQSFVCVLKIFFFVHANKTYPDLLIQMLQQVLTLKLLIQIPFYISLLKKVKIRKIERNQGKASIIIQLQIMQAQSKLAKSAQTSLYPTTNKEYGSSWAQDGTRPEKYDIKKATVPTYGQIVDSINDFKKSERLIKSRVLKEKMDNEGINLDNSMKKTTEFPLQKPTYEYPEHGLKVGPSIYHTNNMNYGSNLPIEHELPNKFYPCNSSFTKGFIGGTFKFNGLNTVKTVSGVHQALNDF